jgi:alpha-tubulin suppressor-like RCC1 family protein
MTLHDKKVKMIEAGDASSACILTDSSVYMWGSGMNGRLGNGDTKQVLIPIRSKELDGKQVIAITKGTNNTFAILDTYQVYGFGSSRGGKLGFELAKGKNYELPR